MARRPRRSAKRPTPRPARRPSAGTPAKAGLPALARRLEREGPQARSARQRRVRDAVAAAVATIRQRVDEGHELWQAATGEPMPLDPGDMKAAAVRFGLPADVVHRGDFTLADLTNFMVGKRQAAADDMLDRARAIQAEAVVRRAAGAVTPGAPKPAGAQAEAADDEYAGIARRLSDNARRTLAYMHKMNAGSRGDKLTRQFLADELGIEIDDMRVIRTELGKVGKVLLETVDGCRGGWWLTPNGVRVAERVAASRPGSGAAIAMTKQA